MASGAYQFRIGSFACAALSDGAFNYPLASFFAQVPEGEITAVLRQHHLPETQITTPYTCLYVQAGPRRILIDNGAGDLWTHAQAIFPGLDHSTTRTGLLMGSLRSIGVQPSDIDTVVITHAHPDHVNGTVDAAGNLVFPNAQYLIGREEWKFWFSEAAPSRALPVMVEVARHQLAPVRDRVTTMDDGHEIAPGLAALATPGHTPGHMAITLASEGEQLFCVADLALHPLHLEHPAWRPIYDMEPERAAASRARVLDRAAVSHALVMAFHFQPFPGLGHVRQAADGWQWQPIDTQG